MAQSGMFVGADSFSAPIRRGVFSHFKKEEDAAMKSGKLDEELARMSEMADHLEDGDKDTQYLRAQRLENGERTFKVVPGEPLQTAFGEDLYQKIFGQSEVTM